MLIMLSPNNVYLAQSLNHLKFTLVALFPILAKIAGSLRLGSAEMDRLMPLGGANAEDGAGFDEVPRALTVAEIGFLEGINKNIR